MMSYKIIKRLFDIVGSIVALVLHLPMIVISSILIFLWDRKTLWADYPDRVGMDGKPFKMYKFRSMIVGAHEMIQFDPKYRKVRSEWVVQEKLPISKDPRITPIGKIIRRMDIDEIPQFFNVIKGDMSIVGPRPYFVEQLKKYIKKYPTVGKRFDIIKTVRPGITGLWQVEGRNRNSIEKRFELEEEYVNNMSFKNDLLILFKTPIEIFKHIIKGEQ